MHSRYALALRHPGGLPRLLGWSFHARCPQPPRKARRVLACCFPTGFRLHPSRRTGHLRFPIEAESGSLALRLACSPIPSSPDRCLHPTLAGLHVRTGNLHGELLSVHKISQAYPGVPTARERCGRSLPGRR